MRILKSYNQIFERNLSDDEYDFLVDLISGDELTEVERIIKKTKIDLNKPYYDDYILISNSTSLDMVKLLVKYGADPFLMNYKGDDLAYFLANNYSFNETKDMLAIFIYLTELGLDWNKTLSAIPENIKGLNILFEKFPEKYKQYQKNQKSKEFNL